MKKIDNLPLHSARRAGFTLVEMLTVIVLISLLLSAAGLSARKARALARQSKAEAEMRELVNAFLEYYVVYHDDKQALNALPKGEVEVKREYLELVADGKKNPKGLVFYNYTFPEDMTVMNDPWGHPYHLIFHDGSKVLKRPTMLETCVSFPYRRRNPLYQPED